MTPPGARLRQDRAVAIGIFFLVLAIYLVTYNGAFKSNDERALFSGTDSFVKRGAFTIGQIYWDYTHVGMLTNSGEMVPNYEPAQMVLTIPLYLWGRALAAAVQGVMFFGLLATAAIAALVFLSLIELGYGRRTAAVVAFVFALATQAWPFSRTLFREPLTTLTYMVAFYALLRYQPPAPRSLIWPAVAGFGLGIAIANKQTSVALIPALLILGFGAGWRRSATWHGCVGPALAAAAHDWRRPHAWRAHLDPAAAAIRVDLRRPGSWPARLAPILAALVPLAAILILYRVYYVATLGDVSAFARNVGEYAINPQLSTSKLAQMAYAFTGITISPYKGLLWYSPVLLLGLIGAWPFLKRRPWEGSACLALVLIHVVGYSRYLYWSGGVVWGSRYLLVLVPFLMLLSAPVFAWLLRDAPAGGAAKEPGADRLQPGQAGNRGAVKASPARIAGWGFTCLLLLLSLGIQILGVSIDWRAYETPFLLGQAKIWGGIGEAIQALYMVPAYSPVIGHLHLLLSGTQPLDFAWVQLRPQGAWAWVPAGLVLALAGVVAAAVALVWIWRRPGRAGLLAAALVLGFIALGSALLLVYRQGDARFDPYNVDRFLRPMSLALEREGNRGQAACCRQLQAGSPVCSGVLVVPDPVLTDYFLNYLRAPLPWYDVYPQPVPAALLDRLRGNYADIWLARDRNAGADEGEGLRGAERYLTEHAYKVDEQGFGDWARLLHFSAAGTPVDAARPQATLGDIVLDQVTLNLARSGLPAACRGGIAPPIDQPLGDGKVEAWTGDTLQIGLNWRAVTKPPANYTVFVQLLDSAGQVKAQRDRWPGDGLFPTAGMGAGQTITDNLALRLDVPPGSYRLIAGLYRNDLPGLPRLKGPGGDFVNLAQVDIRG